MISINKWALQKQNNAYKTKNKIYKKENRFYDVGKDINKSFSDEETENLEHHTRSSTGINQKKKEENTVG